MKIQWTNGAVSEFIEGLGYIAAISPNSAAKMEEKILRTSPRKGVFVLGGEFFCIFCIRGVLCLGISGVSL